MSGDYQTAWVAMMDAGRAYHAARKAHRRASHLRGAWVRAKALVAKLEAQDA